MGLAWDDRALHLLAHQRPGQAVVITLMPLRGYGEALTVKCCSVRAAACTPVFVWLEDQQGVPVYAHRRVAAYVRWKTLRLTTWSLACWHYLAVDREIEVWYDLIRWERTHPST
jgi:hypothetical protein